MEKEFNPSFLEYPKSIRGINEITLRKYSYGANSGTHLTYYYDTNGVIVAEKKK